MCIAVEGAVGGGGGEGTEEGASEIMVGYQLWAIDVI